MQLHLHERVSALQKKGLVHETKELALSHMQEIKGRNAAASTKAKTGKNKILHSKDIRNMMLSETPVPKLASASVDCSMTLYAGFYRVKSATCYVHEYSAPGYGEIGVVCIRNDDGSLMQEASPCPLCNG